MTPRISIVIPVYNEEGIVHSAVVRSRADQAFPRHLTLRMRRHPRRQERRFEEARPLGLREHLIRPSPLDGKATEGQSNALGRELRKHADEGAMHQELAQRGEPDVHGRGGERLHARVALWRVSIVRCVPAIK